MFFSVYHGGISFHLVANFIFPVVYTIFKQTFALKFIARWKKVSQLNLAGKTHNVYNHCDNIIKEGFKQCRSIKNILDNVANIAMCYVRLE